MFHLAQDKHRINMVDSIVVGDKRSDILAGRKANVGRAFLVESGHELEAEARSDAEVYANLFEVSMQLVRAGNK